MKIKNWGYLYACMLCLNIVVAAFAAPTVRRLGTPTPTSSNQVGTGNTLISSRGVTTPKLTNGKVRVASGAATNRLSALPNIKSIKLNSNKLPTSVNTVSMGKGSGTKTSIPTSTTTSSDVAQIKDKVESIESQINNSVININSQEGTYVTDIVKDGNTLQVNKTNYLLVPVIDSATNNVTDKAEIYIVK